jgi:16S rRNA (cytosine967-C5)-methyltransferase
MEDKIKTGLWLKGRWQEEIPPDLPDPVNTNFDTRLELIKNKFNPGAIFPCIKQVSDKVNEDAFYLNHLVSPLIFFRITSKGKNFPGENLPSVFTSSGNEIYSVPPEFPLNEYENKGYIQIQDMASQRICQKTDLSDKQYIWDVCAGAGGKTIHLKDLYPGKDFFVSDLRKSILKNLQERAEMIFGETFSQAVTDLSKPVTWLDFTHKIQTHHLQSDAPFFDALILDVPCTGSGVWRRNPENLIDFDCHRIDHYRILQQQILKHALPFLNKGGCIYYITCSVFEKENEAHIPFWKSCGLEIAFIHYENASEAGGDTMFMAKLVLPLI